MPGTSLMTMLTSPPVTTVLKSAVCAVFVLNPIRFVMADMLAVSISNWTSIASPVSLTANRTDLPESTPAAVIARENDPPPDLKNLS